jgi:hypothetical protein
MLGWQAGERMRHERMGWQASGWVSEGGKSGRQARARRWAHACAGMSGVLCVFEGKGGGTFVVKTGRSRCLAICEAPARAGVEEGISPPRLMLDICLTCVRVRQPG